MLKNKQPNETYEEETKPTIFEKTQREPKKNLF